MPEGNTYGWGYGKVIAAIIAVASLWSAMCHNSPQEDDNVIKHPNGKAFAGSASCQRCHQDIYASHIRTAHYLTSRPADTHSVRGSFSMGENSFVLNDTLKAVMERTDSGMYQAKYVRGREVMRRRMDIVIGSGRKGQTYLYWSDNYLFQLPVSYYAPGDEWCNSPGYPSSQIVFNRNVPGECIECHGTFVSGEKDPFNKMRYDKRSIIYGVDCERCHGPAADHVAFHASHPAEKKASFIINPAVLTRRQQLDNCALCHSGIRSGRTASFSYLTGEKLDDYSSQQNVPDPNAPIDVHGNQYGLLMASKCFKMSKTMTCATCHDVHKDQSGDVGGFSQKCMSCHNGKEAPFCPKAEHMNATIKNNCIDCHMPEMPSKKIFLQLSNAASPVPATIRTHLIARYSDRKLKE